MTISGGKVLSSKLKLAVGRNLVKMGGGILQWDIVLILLVYTYRFN